MKPRRHHNDRAWGDSSGGDSGPDRVINRIRAQRLNRLGFQGGIEERLRPIKRSTNEEGTSLIEKFPSNSAAKAELAAQVQVAKGNGASEFPVLACNRVDDPLSWRLDSAGVAPDEVELRVVECLDDAEATWGSQSELF